MKAVAVLGFLSASLVRFEDVTEKAAISFRHRHGGGGEKNLVETLAGGGGFFDYDSDGDLDIFLLNGAPLPGYQGPLPLENALYRNDGGRFTEVTGEAGLRGSGYSLGAVAGDFDNDGDLDLFVSGFGPSHLYRNHGDGTFTEVTSPSMSDPAFWASAVFFDAEGDGDLDLYATSYAVYRLDNPVYCGNKSRALRTYCHPVNYEGFPDAFYRNEGDGTFSNATKEAGLDVPRARGLGVVATDYDEDGDPDLYVANDTEMNFFFENLGSGRFEEKGLALGVGFDEQGRAQGSMGVDAGDFDGDGRLDLFVTNYEAETNTLYRNLGHGFADVSYSSGLALPSLPWVGFGTNLFDADNDGDPDVFVANGHIMDPEFLSDATSHRQKMQLFENEAGRFTEISSRAGPPFERELVGRGAAFGDWDDDGDVDILLVNNGDAPNLLRNETASGHHWVVLRLVGRESNRDGIGAFVRIEAGGKTQVDELRSGTSYLATNDLRLHFGLGSAERIDRLEIRWPSGRKESRSDLPVDGLLLLVEGLPR